MPNEVMRLYRQSDYGITIVSSDSNTALMAGRDRPLIIFRGLTAARVVLLSRLGAYNGSAFCIVNDSLCSLVVKDEQSGLALLTLSSGDSGDFVFNGVAWEHVRAGSSEVGIDNILVGDGEVLTADGFVLTAV